MTLVSNLVAERTALTVIPDTRFGHFCVAELAGEQLVLSAEGRADDIAALDLAATALFSASPLLLASCRAMLDWFELSATASYCESCEQHAPKDDATGELTGPIPHRANCLLQNAREAIAAAGDVHVVRDTPPAPAIGQPTPGTWKVADGGGCVVSDAPAPRMLFSQDTLEYYGGYLLAESISNPADARIFAAGKDLLNGCRALVETLNDDLSPEQSAAWDVAFAAIAKAEGRA